MKDGYVIKSNENLNNEKAELKLINKLTRRAFGKDEIYAFTVVLCDNDIDRQFERFTDESLEKLAELYIGKTGVLDHDPTSNNQTARIFDCKVETVEGKINKLGAPYKRLVARAYMPKCEKNENVILEIDSGIKKEVSVGCAVERKICSICGENVSKKKCTHKKGSRYKIGNSFQICHVILKDPTDAYEWSFVAIPAQPEAGVIKAFKLSPKGGEKSMNDIIKSLKIGKSITLSSEESNGLFEYIKNLEQKASESDVYRSALTRDIIKLSALAQSEFSENIIKAVADKLPMDMLQTLKKSFRKKVAKIIPAAPQFSLKKSESENPKNVQFKI